MNAFIRGWRASFFCDGYILCQEEATTDEVKKAEREKANKAEAAMNRRKACCSQHCNHRLLLFIVYRHKAEAQAARGHAMEAERTRRDKHVAVTITRWHACSYSYTLELI